MSSIATIEPFKGTNWEECDHFIRAIRAAAWKEGKFRDLAWVADFAALHFSRKALSWHTRLPQDIREDWIKLQVALLDRWSPPEDDDEPRVEPTPAAAPSLNRSDKVDRPPQGVLKLVIHGSNTDHYLEISEDGRGKVTDDANQALRIRCNSLSNATLLERIDGSRHSWLGLQWEVAAPDLKKGSTAFGYLVIVDSLSLKSSWWLSHPYQLTSFTLATDGNVIPVWENANTSKITIGIFSDNDNVYLTADSDAYSKLYPEDKRVTMFVEPIDQSR